MGAGGAWGEPNVWASEELFHKLHGLLWKCGKLNFRKLRDLSLLTSCQTLAEALDCRLRRARNPSRSKPNSRAVPGRGKSAGAVNERETGSANFWSKPDRRGAPEGLILQLDITPVTVHTLVFRRGTVFRPC